MHSHSRRFLLLLLPICVHLTGTHCKMTENFSARASVKSPSNISPSLSKVRESEYFCELGVFAKFQNPRTNILRGKLGCVLSLNIYLKGSITKTEVLGLISALFDEDKED
jgi:hypothetical protein